MYYDSHFEIRETSSYDGDKTAVRIEIDGIFALPATLRRLAEMGHDMTAAHKALTEAVEEQRKRKALDEAVKAMHQPAKSCHE